MEQIKQSFDSFEEKLHDNEHLLSDDQFLKEILQLALSSVNEKQFSETSLISHRVFVILRDHYFHLFQRWRAGEKLSNESSTNFETISNLFLKISSRISQSNVSLFRQYLLDERLLNETNLFLGHLSHEVLDDPSIKSIDNFLRTIERLERFPLDRPNDDLFDRIVQCICSSLFFEVFQSVNTENDHPGHQFLLNTCTDYLYSHSNIKDHCQSLLDIRQSLLPSFSQWFWEQSSLFRLWNNRRISILRQISFLLTLSIQFNRDLLLETSIFDDYCRLIDAFRNIFYSIIQSENLQTPNKFISSLIGTLISNLSTMILSDQLEKYLRKKSITSLLLKLTIYETYEIQINLFQILSTITNEQDTKNSNYSHHLIQHFLRFFRTIIDDPNQTLTFSHLLRCLKNLIQFDQIKEEISRQNGLPLIIRCATETHFQSLQIQQPALEILLALTFHRQAFEELQINLLQIKALLSSPSHGITRAVETIGWKLEKEQEMIIKSQVNEKHYQYDVIFSFAPCNRDFSRKLSDQLLEENIRVLSIDQDRTIDERCQMIDRCEYVLMCISEDYQRDIYSRCEASYAFERRCQIIPLLVTSNFRPDGWLQRIIHGKISVDFGKIQIELARKRLINEIERQRKSPKKNPVIISTSMEIVPTKNECPSEEINQWTNDNVKSFLESKNLHSLLDLCSDMNGKVFYDFYQMCLSNRESMYHTLKREVSTLTLLVYLRFLEETDKYISLSVIYPK